MGPRITDRFVPGQEPGGFRRLASRREPLAGGEPIHSREEQVAVRRVARGRGGAVADVAARLTTALVPFGAALASLSEATAR